MNDAITHLDVSFCGADGTVVVDEDGIDVLVAHGKLALVHVA